MSAGLQYVVDVLMGNHIDVRFRNTVGHTHICADDDKPPVMKKGIVLNALQSIGCGTVAEVAVELERTGNPMEISLVYAQLAYLKKAGEVQSQIHMIGRKRVGVWRVVGG